LEYVTISYARQEANSNGNKANLVVWANTRLAINNCTFSHSSMHGVDMAYNDAYITSFNNNSLKSNVKPLYVLADNVAFLNATNDFTGNANDYVEIGIETLLEGVYVWNKLNVPYRVLATDFGNSREIVVPSNCDLSIEAGTRIDFDTDTGVKIRDGGSFRAIGTSTDKITFSGVDGAPGAWRGFEYNFTLSVLNKLEYCIIEYAGSGDNDAAIYLWAEPRLEVTNCHIKDVDGCVFFDGTPDSPNLNGGFKVPDFSEGFNLFEDISGGVFCTP